MLANRIKDGIYSGVAGGIVFGVMMAAMGMLPMIGGMVGIPSAWAGFLIHLSISTLIGGSFGFVADRLGLAGGLRTGAAYGLVWWLLGPLTLMPLFMGMGLGVNWNLAAMTQALPSLVGHLVFGVVLGITYRWLQRHHHWSPTPHHAGAV